MTRKAKIGIWESGGPHPPHREPPAAPTVGVARGAGTLRYLSSGRSGWWPVWLTAMSSGKDTDLTQPPPAQHCVWNTEHQCPSVTRGPCLTHRAAPRVRGDAHRPQLSPSRERWTHGTHTEEHQQAQKQARRRTHTCTHARTPVTSSAHSMHPAPKGSLQAMLRVGAMCRGAFL